MAQEAENEHLKNFLAERQIIIDNRQKFIREQMAQLAQWDQ